MAAQGATLKAAVALMVVAVCMSRVAEAVNVLQQGYYLASGSQLTEGVFRFVMQSDCNLVLYKNSQALWASNTNGRGNNCYFIMQTDGNAVVYTGGNQAVFATNTCCRNDGSHYIILQSDGNVVMYNPYGPIWATNTGGRKLELVDAGFTDPTAPKRNAVFEEQHLEVIHGDGVIMSA